jgi:beta-N-acetylhexosaminidase
MIQDVLRRQLGFQGAVVTDALEMAGVAEKYGSAEAGVRALLAGADILLMPARAADTHAATLAALHAGRLPQARLDDAAARSIALMLHEQDAGAAPSTKVLGAAEATSYAASLRGLTVVSGACEGALVGKRITVAGGRTQDRARLTKAARKAGLTVGADGDVVRLLSAGSSSGSGDVVVALDTPYGLARSSASTARIALFGRTEGAFAALVDVLTGKARGAGRLPVHVGGLPSTPHCDQVGS